jgi:hypothetical protein
MSSRFMLRIIAPVAAVSALLLAVGVTAAWYVHRQNKEATDILSHNLAAVLNSERLVIGIQESARFNAAIVSCLASTVSVPLTYSMV